MLSIVEVEQVEKEASAFDDYDRENGYEDEDEQPEENQWKVCGEIVDRVVKIAIRLLKNSYSQCERDSCCRRKEDGQNNRRPLPLRRIRACTVRAVIKNKDIKKRTTPISGCRPCVIMNL